MENDVEIASFSFSDFPEDVQLCILSFLTPAEISVFACTSKRFVSLCRDDHKLWFSMCHRRWGSKTVVNKWGSGKISYKLLYMTLLEYENLIGFWRRSGSPAAGSLGSPQPSPPLVFFEWGPFYITGSRVSPSKTGTYKIVKSPFLWIGITSRGELFSYSDPDGRLETESSENLMNSDELGSAEGELVPVNVNFIGECHVVVEENGLSFGCTSSPQNGGFRRVSSSGSVKVDEIEDVVRSPGSFPDHLKSEIYQYFANRTSPGGNGSCRRQRRREKERQGRKKLEAEHLVKIVNCSPTSTRPLQGLWKGFCDDSNLDFYLVSYDDVGGIACRRVGDSSKPFPGYAPVFWTSDTTFVEYPPSPEEEHVYDSRIHLQPLARRDDNHVHLRFSNVGSVVRMLYMNSSFDLVIPDSTGITANPRQVEGRIWQYENGTFGFGFLRDNYIIDLKHIAQNGHLLDAIESCNG